MRDQDEVEDMDDFFSAVQSDTNDTALLDIYTMQGTARYGRGTPAGMIDHGLGMVLGDGLGT